MAEGNLSGVFGFNCRGRSEVNERSMAQMGANSRAGRVYLVVVRGDDEMMVNRKREQDGNWTGSCR